MRLDEHFFLIPPYEGLSISNELKSTRVCLKNIFKNSSQKAVFYNSFQKSYLLFSRIKVTFFFFFGVFQYFLKITFILIL